MRTFESVVCGVDGSAGSIAAARVAADLAGGARLVLVHARAPAADGSREQALAEAEAVLRHVAAEAGCEADAELRPEIGDPVLRLVGLAQELAPALLVVGSRGRSAIGAAQLGSVSWALLGMASMPVVVVPPPPMAT